MHPVPYWEEEEELLNDSTMIKRLGWGRIFSINARSQYLGMLRAGQSGRQVANVSGVAQYHDFCNATTLLIRPEIDEIWTYKDYIMTSSFVT